MFGEHMQDLLQHTTEPEPEEPPRELTRRGSARDCDPAASGRPARGSERRLRPDSYGRSGNPTGAAFLRRARAPVGRSSEGMELIEKSLALVPDSADWHSNLGIVLQESSQLDESD